MRTTQVLQFSGFIILILYGAFSIYQIIWFQGRLSALSGNINPPQIYIEIFQFTGLLWFLGASLLASLLLILITSIIASIENRAIQGGMQIEDDSNAALIAILALIPSIVFVLLIMAIIRAPIQANKCKHYLPSKTIKEQETIESSRQEQ